MSDHRTLVLGAGIVGRAAAWDLQRRGHDVTLADAQAEVAESTANEIGLRWMQLDVGETVALDQVLPSHDSIVSAVPYVFGETVATRAIAAGCNYFDLGGNPTIVKHQLELHNDAVAAGVAVVPDCGLAPGLANVIAAGLIEACPAEHIDDVQIRVGVLPQEPAGTLQYQLVFNAGGLINEYAEPCEILSNGTVTTVEPLTRTETIKWDSSATYEAFATAGGTSTMCQDYAGRVGQLEYKTLRYPGHGRIFSAMRELGLFDTTPRSIAGVDVSPREVLVDQLTTNLPRDGADMTLVSISLRAGDYSRNVRLGDVADGRFSSLARTTAFPTTALCDLIATGEVTFLGAAAMHAVAPCDLLIAGLEQVGIVTQNT